MKNLSISYLHWAQEKINQRSKKERMFLLGFGAVIIWAFTQWLMVSPLQHRIAEVKKDELQLQEKLAREQRDITYLEEKLNKKGHVGQEKEYHQLQTLLNEHNQAITPFHKKMIAPERIPWVLEALLKNFSGLKLITRQVIPPKELYQSHEPVEPVYERYRIKMVFTGEYQQLYEFVRAMERLAYPLRWDSLDYKMLQFPQAEIALSVSMHVK